MRNSRTIEDGFGGRWIRCRYADCDLHVVRPGKVQCSNCNVEALRAERGMLREIPAILARKADAARAEGKTEIVIRLDDELFEKLKTLIEGGCLGEVYSPWQKDSCARPCQKRARRPTARGRRKSDA